MQVILCIEGKLNKRIAFDVVVINLDPSSRGMWCANLKIAHAYFQLVMINLIKLFKKLITNDNLNCILDRNALLKIL